MTGDPQYGNIPLLAAFLKSFGRAYLGPQPTEGEVAQELPEGIEELIPQEVQKKMRELFINYFETASKTLVKGQMVCYMRIPVLLTSETSRTGQAQS